MKSYAQLSVPSIGSSTDFQDGTRPIQMHLLSAAETFVIVAGLWQNYLVRSDLIGSSPASDSSVSD